MGYTTNDFTYIAIPVIVCAIVLFPFVKKCIIRRRLQRQQQRERLPFHTGDVMQFARRHHRPRRRNNGNIHMNIHNNNNSNINHTNWRLFPAFRPRQSDSAAAAMIEELFVQAMLFRLMHGSSGMEQSPMVEDSSVTTLLLHTKAYVKPVERKEEEGDGDGEEGKEKEQSGDYSYNSMCCSVCLSEFKEGDIVACSTCHEHDADGGSGQHQCRHIFHEACIRSWLKRSNSCPLCKNVFAREVETSLPTVHPVNHEDEGVTFNLSSRIIHNEDDVDLESNANFPAERETVTDYAGNLPSSYDSPAPTPTGLPLSRLITTSGTENVRNVRSFVHTLMQAENLDPEEQTDLQSIAWINYFLAALFNNPLTSSNHSTTPHETQFQSIRIDQYGQDEPGSEEGNAENEILKDLHAVD